MKLESELSKPIQDWLESRGYTVYTEVPTPYHSSFVDIVGYDKDVRDEIIAVELKKSLTRKVIQQALLNQLPFDFSYCAVFTKPHEYSIMKCRKHGIGILRVDNGKVEVIYPAKSTINKSHYREKVLEYINLAEPGGIGGKPNVEGGGPAQDVYNKVQKLRIIEPRITWKILFERVPNHYSNYKSMRSAMSSVKKEREI